MVVDLRQPTQRLGAPARHLLVALHHREERRELTLLHSGAVPAEQHVVGGDWVAIRKVRVSTQVKGVGESVGGDVWKACRKVGDLVQLLIESVETGEHVSQHVDIGR